MRTVLISLFLAFTYCLFFWFYVFLYLLLHYKISRHSLSWLPPFSSSPFHSLNSLFTNFAIFIFSLKCISVFTIVEMILPSIWHTFLWPSLCCHSSPWANKSAVGGVLLHDPHLYVMTVKTLWSSLITGNLFLPLLFYFILLICKSFRLNISRRYLLPVTSFNAAYKMREYKISF